MTTPLPWSHSSIEQFHTCPRKYEELKVLRNFQDEKNPASLWGDEVHKAFEKWIRHVVELKPLVGVEGAIADAELHNVLPVSMQQYVPYLRQFVIRPGTTLAEQQYAITRELKPCDFFAPDVWGRGIIDVLTLDGNVADVDDHKTGKNRKVDMQQLIIFAILTFYHHPQIDTVRTRFHWLQLGAVDERVFYRHQIPELWGGYPANAHRDAWEGLVARLERYAKAFHLGVFPPKKSGLCRKFCAVKTCEYWGGTR